MIPLPSVALLLALAATHIAVATPAQAVARDPSGEPVAGPSLICLVCEPDPGPSTPSGCYGQRIDKQLTPGSNPEFGGEYVRVNWTGVMTCNVTSGGNPVPISVSGRTLLVDRGEEHDGGVLAFGQSFSGGAGSYSSSGETELYHIDHPIGAQAELLLEFRVQAPAGRAWTSCNPVPGLRYVRCDGLGTNVINVTLGTGAFSTGVVPKTSCIYWNTPQQVKMPDGYVLASPIVTVRVCNNFSTKNVESAKTEAVASGARVPGLVAPTPSPLPQPVKVIDSGHTAYSLVFSYTYTWMRQYTRSAEVLGKKGQIGYQEGDQCQITFNVLFSVVDRRLIVDSSINPCASWSPGNVSMLDVDRPTYDVGQSTAFTVAGAPPNSPITWSVRRDGVPSGALGSCLSGHVTDGNGNWSGTCPAWSLTHLGNWIATAHVGQHFDRIGFDVEQRVVLTAAHSNKCLDLAAFSHDDGGIVHQWTCHGGSNQQWRLHQVAPNTYLVVSALSGKCLDVAAFSQDDGGTVYQWTCHGGDNQQWRLNAAPTNGQIVSLTAVHSGKCLDVAAFSQDDGGTVYQWTCHGGSNQQWRVAAAA